MNVIELNHRTNKNHANKAMNSPEYRYYDDPKQQRKEVRVMLIDS